MEKQDPKSVIKKILIVDDKIENIIALEILLKDFDAEIIRAISGNEALEMTIEHDFALALIDVQMPDMDGYETVKLMRQVERTKYLPIIFLSAIYSEVHYFIQGIEAGAVDFITKPFNPRIVLGKVKVFLELFEQKKKLELEIERRKQTEASLLETEKWLIEARKKAEEADRLKTAFLANMSHEIRTPLTSIIGFAEILSEVDLSQKKKKEFASFIYKASEGLISLINDILDVAKIEAEQFKINVKNVRINEILHDLYAVFQEDLKRRKKTNITLKLTIPDNTIEILLTDENRFRQIFSNLIGNAIKFTVEGTIEFGYNLKADELEFFVRDTGIGIPKDKFELVFDRFQKLKNEKIQNSSGTGLGLSIVKKIIEMLKGKIWIESEINKGTSFIFTLPCSMETGLQKSKLNVEEVVTDSINWSTKKILIVEDEYPTFVLFETFLAPTKVKLQWAKNGREAIEAFKSNTTVDVVLMDIKMPEKTGLETFKELRSLNKNLPIIAQTAYAMADEKEYLHEMGFNGYLAKPIIKKELLVMLNSVMK